MKKRSIGSWTGRAASVGLALAAAHCSSSGDGGTDVPGFAGPSGTAGAGTPGVVTPGAPGTPATPGAPGAPATPGAPGTGTNEGAPNVGGLTDPAAPGGTPAGAGGAAAVPGTPVPPVGVGTAAPDLSCGGITVAAADVISDFSTGEAIMYPVGTRGGTSWESYAATPASDPQMGGTFEVDATQSGPCNSGGSLHVVSTGNTDYGVGFGVNFKPDITPGVSDLYDASADGYTGVGFWANCAQEVPFALLKFSDDATDASVQNPQCTDATCRQYGIKNAVLLSGQWVHYELYFDEALLDTNATVAGSALHANALTAIQIQLNSKGANQPNGFDCHIDDVHFLRTPTPRAAAPANVTTVAGHTIAPGGYYTEGNQIFDSTGAAHLFKGFARPTFEFDAAGQGITRNDVQLMRDYGANVVRYALSEGFWLSTHPQFNANYQAYIDRAVQWTLQAGMDVILDLHWSGNPAAQQSMADRQSITFWQELAAKYKNDGRVIFELYNEPHDVSPQVWLGGDGQSAGMQEMYAAVRAAGANNLVLVGGLDFAYDLDGLLPGMQVVGTNIAYVTHPYRFKAPAPPAGYDNSSAAFPIVATEFGDAAAGGIQPDNCDTATYASSIADFTRRGMGWTAWAWVVAPERCAFPALLEKYDGTPTPPGQVVFDALRN